MISDIQKKIKNGEYEFSKHAVDQSIIRNITVDEIFESFLNGKIIEDYPNDKYGPSCLVYGVTNNGRNIHIQCSYPSRAYIKVITVYEPDEKLWINNEIRRRK